MINVMRRHMIAGLVLCSAMGRLAPAPGVEPREIELWPAGVPEPRVPAEPAEVVEKKADGIERRSNVSNPRLVVYDIPRGEAAKPRSVVLVVPGGGFHMLASEHEGSDVCRWLNDHGIVSCLVLHRVPTGTMPVPHAAPVQDIHKAIQEVRQRAAEFHIDPAKIALLGFSAGGQAALIAATRAPTFPQTAPPVSARPDAALLLYPWKIVGEGNQGVRADVTIDGTTPPMFIAQAGDDSASVPQGSANLYLELVKAKVPAELHIYETGGHGFGLKAGNVLPGQLDWKGRVIDWLRSRGW